MNYTTAVFLINKNVRCVKVSYEPDRMSAADVLYKTLDPDIKKDDLVVVPTCTRHLMTVCKVTEVNVDVDFDSPTPMQWIVQRVDREAYQVVLDQENQALDVIKSAEHRRKREELRDALLKDQVATIKALPIAAMNGDAPSA